MQRALRFWGITLLVLGLITLILAWREIKEPFVSDLIIIGAILVGQLLPLPAAIDNRLRRWGMGLKILVLAIAIGLYAGLIMLLHDLTGLELQYGPPITFLILGLILLALGRLRRPTRAPQPAPSAPASTPKPES